MSENDDILCMEANNVEKESMQLQIIQDDHPLSASNCAFYPAESVTNKSGQGHELFSSQTMGAMPTSAKGSQVYLNTVKGSQEQTDLSQIKELNSGANNISASMQQ